MLQDHTTGEYQKMFLIILGFFISKLMIVPQGPKKLSSIKLKAPFPNRKRRPNRYTNNGNIAKFISPPPLLKTRKCAIKPSEMASFSNFRL